MKKKQVLLTSMTALALMARANAVLAEETASSAPQPVDALSTDVTSALNSINTLANDPAFTELAPAIEGDIQPTIEVIDAEIEAKSAELLAVSTRSLEDVPAQSNAINETLAQIEETKAQIEEIDASNKALDAAVNANAQELATAEAALTAAEQELAASAPKASNPAPAIQLTDAYMQAIWGYDQQGGPRHNQLFDTLRSESKALRDRYYNTYTPSESDRAVKLGSVKDLNKNLTHEQRVELSQFAVDIINNLRSQMDNYLPYGLVTPKAVVTSSSVDLTKQLTERFEANAHDDIDGGHDYNTIYDVLVGENGFTTTTSRNNYNPIENKGGFLYSDLGKNKILESTDPFDVDDDYLTLGGLKRAVHNIILDFLFHNAYGQSYERDALEWDHASSVLLGSGLPNVRLADIRATDDPANKTKQETLNIYVNRSKNRQEQTFDAVGFVPQKDKYTDLYNLSLSLIGFDKAAVDYSGKNSNFDQTPIPAKTQDAASSDKALLTQKVNDLKAKRDAVLAESRELNKKSPLDTSVLKQTLKDLENSYNTLVSEAAQPATQPVAKPVSETKPEVKPAVKPVTESKPAAESKPVETKPTETTSVRPEINPIDNKSANKTEEKVDAKPSEKTVEQLDQVKPERRTTAVKPAETAEHRESARKLTGTHPAQGPSVPIKFNQSPAKPVLSQAVSASPGSRQLDVVTEGDRQPTYSRLARSAARQTLPLTGEGTSVLGFLGAGLSALGMLGLKRRPK